MTDGQARRLWNRASAVEARGQIVEIGSYRGRSTILLARAAAPGVGVIAIDPHAGNDRGPREIHGRLEEGTADLQAFRANIAAAGVGDRVRHIRRPSRQAAEEVAGPIELLYVDGAHRYRPAADDLTRWGPRVAAGGTMLVHDAFSSIGVTFALIRHVVFGRDFAFAGRTRSLAEYRRVDLRGRRRVVNAARQVAQLSWFARNVAIKIAIVARLWPLARRLSGGPAEWPY